MIDPSERADNIWRDRQPDEEPRGEPTALGIHFDVKMWVRVWDSGQLYAAAVESYRKDVDGINPTDAEIVEMLGTADEPDLGACLVQLLDPGSIPGVEIYETVADTVDEERE